MFNGGGTSMKNTKYLRSVFCAMVLLGMSQQTSPVKLSLKEKIQRAEELKIAERRVVETEQLVNQAEKEANRKEEERNQEEKKAERLGKKAGKKEKPMVQKRQAYSDALAAVACFLDCNPNPNAVNSLEMKKLMQKQRAAKTKWNKAKKIWAKVSRAKTNARLACVGANHVHFQAISAAMQAKDDAIQAKKEYKKAYRKVQGRAS